ncbi:mitochondrial carrier domain-containing protein [Boletus reticuloceps]|uniref:Mitochondrial carrier domain-containing protein n=1 Tax=Boletus reticuloceps TaxID=495285 RepID=A0A8I2YNK8_9AGAM|nr:mitochondrial carrier domain-containing protein [Boletus reticuloceps]
MLKKRASGDDPNFRLSAGGYLTCSAEASAATAIMTNPIWVVKVRMFTTRADDPKSYRGLWHGLSSIYSTEGIRGLWKGTSLALFGVSNGAVQFTAHEELKQWGFERKRGQFARAGKTMTPEDDKLSNTAYTVMSGASKLFALVITYPYQVIRSRIQVGFISSSVLRVSRIFPLHRIMPRRTYTLISPPPSSERGKARASKDSTADSEQIWFASSLGHVSRLSCMRTWRGYFGPPLSGGNRVDRKLDCRSPHTSHAGKEYVLRSASRSKGVELGFIDGHARGHRTHTSIHPNSSKDLGKYISNSSHHGWSVKITITCECHRKERLHRYSVASLLRTRGQGEQGRDWSITWLPALETIASLRRTNRNRTNDKVKQLTSHFPPKNQRNQHINNTSAYNLKTRLYAEPGRDWTKGVPALVNVYVIEDSGLPTSESAPVHVASWMPTLTSTVQRVMYP